MDLKATRVGPALPGRMSPAPRCPSAALRQEGGPAGGTWVPSALFPQTSRRHRPALGGGRGTPRPYLNTFQQTSSLPAACPMD